MKPTLLYAVAALAYVSSLASANHDPEGAREAMMAAHHKMMAAMEELEPSGDADRDFVEMMIPHHQGAIDAARVKLEFGHDEALRAMAEEIITAQEREIVEMEEWLEAHPQ
jgi:uncharacterized protein (DUF305 family)